MIPRPDDEVPSGEKPASPDDTPRPGRQLGAGKKPSHDPSRSGNGEPWHALARIWKTAHPPEPTEEAWADVLAGIHNGLGQREVGSSPAPTPSPGSSRHMVWVITTLSAAAAAVLLGLLLERIHSRPLPVAEPEDVEIISVEAPESSGLPVGERPVKEPIVLAAPEDVTVENLEPDEDGLVPSLHLTPEGPSVPMLVAPDTNPG